MAVDAVTFVTWDTLRSGKGKRPLYRANFFATGSRRILKVAGGGTLWVVTSFVRNHETRSQRVHTLAYKLAGCDILPSEELDRIPDRNPRWKYAIVATDAANTHHFSFSRRVVCDFTEQLSALEFEGIGCWPGHFSLGRWLSLSQFPEPVEDSRMRLIWMERKLLYGRRVLISYARQDKEIASIIQQGLEERGLSVWRDLTDLRVGENWRQAIQENLAMAEAFVVVLSPDSVGSAAVLEEIREACQSFTRPDGVRGIFPVLTAGYSWQQVCWDDLERGHAVPLRDLDVVTMTPDDAAVDLDRLALSIGKTTSRRA